MTTRVGVTNEVVVAVGFGVGFSVGFGVGFGVGVAKVVGVGAKLGVGVAVGIADKVGVGLNVTVGNSVVDVDGVEDVDPVCDTVGTVVTTEEPTVSADRFKREVKMPEIERIKSPIASHIKVSLLRFLLVFSRGFEFFIRSLSRWPKTRRYRRNKSTDRRDRR